MLDHDPLWYKDAIIYELHVRAFHDSVGDGMGDFRGLTQKLDYLHDLGVTALWLLPFYPSPLRDDGYDIAEYTTIHPDYGTLRDFREFLDEAHKRGLRVITELVINHTSDLHPWFQRARRSPPGSRERDFYVWSDTPHKYRDARVIFKDFEASNWTWDPVAEAYFWHRFYSHQPDLNYDNPAVWDAIFPVVDFWLDMGVDGMRLDAVPYLYEREGTSCENLPETHAFLKAIRRHVDSKYTNRMLLSEANQWPEDAVAYFGEGDESHMNFHFPLMPRLFMAIHQEDRFPILDIMAQTPAIAENCQWVLFLRNHDELTLEMVTDEERDSMYRAYAGDPRARINLGIRRRLAPLLGNDRRRIELMKALLFSLRGTPVVYYGDEIGMGDNFYLGDRNGVRTPMQWSGDRNAGFSRANPQRLYLPVIIDPEYHYETVNVEAQQNNANSLLWWMKRLIALRKQHRAFGRGTLEFLHPENRKVLAFLRRHEGEAILVVCNLSRFMQHVELDLAAFADQVPVELFGRTALPPIGKQPYFLTLGPHAFYWFALQARETTTENGFTATAPEELPVLQVAGTWEDVFRPAGRGRLEALLPACLRRQRWFGGKAREVKAAVLRSSYRVGYGESAAFVTLVEVEFTEGAADTYVLPLTFATGKRAERVREQAPHAAVALVQGGSDGLLYDALADPAFCAALLEAVTSGRAYTVGSGELVASAFPAFAAARGPADMALPPVLGKAEQSNTSVIYGGRLILKVFRRVEDGPNPDLEIGRYLSEIKGFAHTAPVVGAIEHRPRRGIATTLALLQSFVPNEGDAWQFTLDELGRFFERALASPPERARVEPEGAALPELAAREIPATARELIEIYLDRVALLGQRTAEMHVALAAPSDNPAFAPEPFSAHYQRSLYQSFRNNQAQVFTQLRAHLGELPEAARDLGQQVLERQHEILQRARTLLERKVTTVRTRTHGDYHLGQVLYTGKDFVIIDFEGEPARPVSERRIKRSPLRDVGGMLRSFHYAAYTALSGRRVRGGETPGMIRPEDVTALEAWAKFWYAWVCAAFLKAYLDAAAPGGFLPRSRDDLRVLLDAFLLEKAVYELGYELNHRPDWVRIPLLGILHLLGPQGEPGA